jgi:hypothetical protein
MEKKLIRLERNIDGLCYLSKCTPKIRKAIINNANKDLIYTLCEIALNVLNGNIKLEKDLVQKLKPHKNCLRNLANRNSSIKLKKSYINQKGGSWLALILPPVIEAVKSLSKYEIHKENDACPSCQD